MTDRTAPHAPPPRLLGAGAGPSLRDIVGELLRTSRQADFALARIRLAAVDLLPQEMTGIERCRVLIGRLDAATLLDAAIDARRDAAGRRRIAVLRELAMSGSLEARAAGIDGWSPDFSVFRGSAGPVASLVGAHWFHTPPAGTAITAVLHARDAAADIVALAAAFERLWHSGHDVLDVVREALDTGVEEPRGSQPSSPPSVNAATGPEAEQPSPNAGGGRIGEPRRCWPETDAVTVARLIARSCFASPALVEPAVFELAAFQQEAARRAEAVLQRRGGVLIADGVGLGKTYIALALIERRLRNGGSVAVVIPAPVRRQWLTPLRRLCARLRVPPPAERGGGEPIRVLVLTHTRLSRLRGTAPSPTATKLSLVVVDEAHAFRNPATNRYRALAELCRGVPVALVTATPVNNSPLDLYWLLRLFAANTAFADIGIADLLGAFREAAGSDGDALPEEVRPVVRALMIRRTRPFLRDHYAAVRLPGSGTELTFPRREAPRSIDYRLDAAVPEALSRIRSALAGFRAHAYRADPARSTLPGPRSVERDARDAIDAQAAPNGGGVAPLLRLLLLKRLESGVPAFRASVRRQLEFHEAALRALGYGRLPQPRHHARAEDLDPFQLRLDELLLRPLPRSVDGDALRRLIASDRDRLREMLDATAPLDGDADPKLAALRRLLDEMAGRKVLIFTEYRDTARHLHGALLPRGGVGLIHGAEARAGAHRCSRGEVIRRFAPLANGAPIPPFAQRIDILIATDVLAEGLNLQDAADVIGYDLPWNPIRLVQRVGRVDRLGSPHEAVRAWQFLPEPRLERMLRIADRLRRKIDGIEGTVGSTEGVLPGAPTLPFPRGVVARLRAGDPAALDDVEREEAAPFELEERLRLELAKRLRSDSPGTSVQSGNTRPQAERREVAPPDPERERAAHARTWISDPATESVLVGLETPHGSECLVVGRDGRPRRDDALALRLLLDAIDDADSPQFILRDDGTQRIPAPRLAPTAAARRAVAAALAHQSITVAGAEAGPLAVTTVGRTASRASARLLRALSLEQAPPADLCRRVETLLRRLRSNTAVAAELRLRDALRKLRAARPPDALHTIEALEAALPAPQADGDRSGERVNATGPPVARVFASLEFRCARGRVASKPATDPESTTRSG